MFIENMLCVLYRILLISLSLSLFFIKAGRLFSQNAVYSIYQPYLQCRKQKLVTVSNFQRRLPSLQNNLIYVFLLLYNKVVYYYVHFASKENEV